MVVTVNEPAERIAFLANSEHRITILRTIHDRPQTARRLRNRTDASRATIGRVLNDFADRNWIHKHDGEYEIAPAGELVVEEVTSLLETMDRVAVLEEIGECLPVGEIAVPLRALGDAELVRPTDGNPHSHIDHAIERLHEASDLRAIVDSVVPRYLTAVRDRTVDGRLRSRQVFSASVVETIENHGRMATDLQDLLAAGGTVWRHDESIPFDVFVLDRSVLFLLSAETGLPRALLETDNEAVVEWADATFEFYRARASPLDDRGVPV